MRRLGQRYLLYFLAGLTIIGIVQTMHAQNFGSLIINRKKIALQRKLPPTGHVEGTTFKVNVDATGLQADLATDLKSTLESMLIHNDSRLRSEDGSPDTVISCRITTYATPQPQMTSQAVLTPGQKNKVQSQPMERITGVLTVSFQAKDRSGKSLGADIVTAKFDKEYSANGAQKGVMYSMTHTVSHLTKGGTDDDTPPTQADLHNRLIQEAAQQITAHLVNTTEQVEVYLAKGGGLDEANKLMEQKLWTRAMEQLETMKPFPTPEDDAYRLYDLGVVNEALAYQAEDIEKARKELQEASIDYGKAIDGKPTEKYFMQPQTRIDTALAHYKVLGEQKAPAPSTANASPARGSADAPVPAPATAPVPAPATAAKATSSASSDTITNDQVISMVSAGIDDANIVDTIQHAKAVNFDLSVQGQVDLAKNKVSGRIISAMKARARTPATHRPTSGAGKSAN